MAIRLSGLTSGLDTDAIVQELVSAYSLKTQKYEKAQTKLEWKQETWKNLNTKIYSLYQNVSSLRYSPAYNLRKVTLSDNTKATVSASAEAVTGTQKLNILQTAQAGYITGGQLKEGVKSDTKMSELGYTGTKGTIEVTTGDGKTEQITVGKDTTVSEFINSLKGAGVNASFDEANRRIFVSAKETGSKNDFTLSWGDINGEAALKSLGLDTALVTTDAEGNTIFTKSAEKYKGYYEYYTKATDTDGDGKVSANEVKEYLRSQVDLYDEYIKERNLANAVVQKTGAENRSLQEKVKVREAYDRMGDALTQKLGAYGITADDILTTTDETGAIDQTKLEELLTAHAPEGTDAEAIKADAEAFLSTETIKADVKTVSNYEKPQESGEVLKAADIDKDALNTTIAENEEKIAAAETQMKESNDKIAGLGLDVDSLVRLRDNDEEGGEVVFERKMYEIAEMAVKANEILTSGNYTTGSASKLDASDAQIRLNGVLYTSNSNSFSINGLTIEATGVTGDGDANAMTVTTSVDTQGIYDKIKDFLTEYNNVINEMTKLYNAESAKDYEPLTDEEKEAMSEDEIEKWENKIKSALLRRDSTLEGVRSAMINAMAQTVEVNGKKLSLSTFGIGTLGFLNAPDNENYAYHINGDEDDENTADQEDKLMKAIQENPEDVCEFMKKLTSNLYTAIDNKMKSTSLSSAYKVYNDKEMDKQMAEYKTTISKWEEKISDKEEYYYNKFTQMETALSKLQNQTSSISSLLGS